MNFSVEGSLLIIAVSIALIAVLYSAVGHGGASGYIAVLALFGYSAVYIRQDALMLNMLVSGMAFWKFYRGGYFNWKLFLPLSLASVPMAYLGGSIELETGVYKIILGALLLIPAILFIVDMSSSDVQSRPIPLWISATMGVILGFISGLTGIGGGVFLSPILVLGKWADQKRTAAISAPFIFVNSAAGLLGNSANQGLLDNQVWWFFIAAATGGIIGASLGSGVFKAPVLRKILAGVLLVAALKLMLI